MLSAHGSGPTLRGRRGQCDTLLGLVRAAGAGHSSSLVLRGESGIGKTALMDFLALTATGCRILRISGMESQVTFSYSGLHELCSPLLDSITRLPEPQADAIAAAFGMRAGSPPDRFLLGLAVLNLLAETAREEPVVCLVDDAQWLDRSTADTLAFVGRRAAPEPIVLVFAMRTGEQCPALIDLPQMMVPALSEDDAGALLQSVIPGPLDHRVRTRILAETRGNPQAILELPRWLTSAELAFGPQPSWTGTTVVRLEQGYLGRLEPLPRDSRLLMLIAAAEPLGDAALLWRAAQRLHIGGEASVPAEASGLIEIGDTVRFLHPIARSVVYRSATPQERQSVHGALADVTDASLDPDRRAWHRANAADGPAEPVAAELEQCAQRALAHGGLAAAASCLSRAAALTPAPADRAERELKAAEAMMQAGSLDAALHLLSSAYAGPLTDLQRGRVDVLRAQIGFSSHRRSDALPALLEAARRLEPLDHQLAVNSYVDALAAALQAGRFANGTSAGQVAQAARDALSVPQQRGDELIMAVEVLLAEGYPAAANQLQRAVTAFDAENLSTEEGLRFLWLANVLAAHTFDKVTWDKLATRHVQLTRASGALDAWDLALNNRAHVDLFAGNLGAAAQMVEEIRTLGTIAETRTTPQAEISLAAFRGHVSVAAPLIAAALRDAIAEGEGIGVSMAHWAQAVLSNAVGHYAGAVEAGRSAVGRRDELGVSSWGLVELIEGASRAGEADTAAAALEQLDAITEASATDWACGVRARSAALLGQGPAAEDLFQEALSRLQCSGVPPELARAQLLYGEWLRRAGRRVDARAQLRVAHDTLLRMGLDGFATRARHELAATGETVRKRTDDTRQALTAQELHIGRLAADGLTNPEIAAELFISPRTVEWHLGKVFAKLGVMARRDLVEALHVTSEDPQPSPPSGDWSTARVEHPGQPLP
jgi:DNA-binding CsgD family transcriptional regulator